ncbi:MAG: MotA/TolQ/ExbB proton channel family protein [Nitrospirota bacterium]
MAEGTSFPSATIHSIERLTMLEIHMALEALHFGGAMIYPLLILGVLALAIILDKTYIYRRYVTLPVSLQALVETYGFAWADLKQQTASLVPGNYFGRFFQVIYDNRTNPSWWVESRAADEAQLIEKALSRGLWVLETIVTAAPLLGLVGTIVGMMESFKLIGGSGLVNPTGITGGVAQALIATTLGLIIALIALFAFNFFSHLQSRIMDEMERLGTRLVDHIRMDQEKNGTI